MFRNNYSLCAILFLLASSASAGDDSPPDVSKFPKLNGTLAEFMGHSFGYIPPRKGMLVVLDLAELTRPFGDLQHDSKTKQPAGSIEFGTRDEADMNLDKYGYIPFPEPFIPQDVRYYDNGEFESARFISRPEKAPSSHRVTIDVNRHPGNGPNGPAIRVWIIIETGNRTIGVAVIDCEVDGALPGQKNHEVAK